jgi:hypothetical protein
MYNVQMLILCFVKRRPKLRNGPEKIVGTPQNSGLRTPMVIAVVDIVDL